MKAIILTLLIWIIPLAFAKESAWRKTHLNIARYSVLNRMTFRKPVVFTPFDFKVGLLFYGRKKYWSQLPYNFSDITITDSPILLDSTQYEFNVIEKPAARQGIFLEVDFLRTNFTHFIFHQNYIDLQMGLGVQMINYFPNPSLPSDAGKEWNRSTGKNDFYFHPRSIGLNLNTSFSWQLFRRNLSYVYHSLGISSVSLYESYSGDRSLKGFGLNESFGMGTKYIFDPKHTNYNYTIGVEVKWNRLFMSSVNAPEGFSPIYGVDIRASGIFLTSGIQFGGKHTKGDIAYSQMMHNDFISASENFLIFLDREARHVKREKAIKMLQYCQSQIPYQKVALGIDSYFRSDIDGAIEWFNSAKSDADEKLIQEIQNNLQIIASELLDSVINHKNKMSIINAEKLALLAGRLHPESRQYSQVMAGLYMDKAKLNSKIGNYSKAVDNYNKALQLLPEIEYIIKENLRSIAKSLMQDAYTSYNKNEIYMVLKSMKDFTMLQPKMSQELDPYIRKLETQIEESQGEKIDKHVQQYIIDKKHESFNLTESVLQLGMTYEEAKSIQGTPQSIDKYTEKDQEFEMWIYPKEKAFSQLYFRNNMLIKIEK